MSFMFSRRARSPQESSDRFSATVISPEFIALARNCDSSEPVQQRTAEGGASPPRESQIHRTPRLFHLFFIPSLGLSDDQRQFQ